jgi:hypothetical protein
MSLDDLGRIEEMVVERAQILLPVTNFGRSYREGKAAQDTETAAQ